MKYPTVTPEYNHYVKILDEMIADTNYAWANQLPGIRETIVQTQKVTSKQINAIMNIRRAMK